MKNGEAIKTILFLLVAAAITGCATPASVTHMVPPIDTASLISTDKTLMVAEVRGGEKTNPMGFSKIESEGFQEALLYTLNGSGMFKRVFVGERGDYELRTEIISQKLNPGFTMTAVLFVNYRLIETQSNKELWEESILSQYDAEFKEAFVGVERAKKANEGAVRDNLTQLLNKLSDILKSTK